jgi:hypothetical protein
MRRVSNFVQYVDVRWWTVKAIGSSYSCELCVPEITHVHGNNWNCYTQNKQQSFPYSENTMWVHSFHCNTVFSANQGFTATLCLIQLSWITCPNQNWNIKCMQNRIKPRLIENSTKQYTGITVKWSKTAKRMLKVLYGTLPKHKASLKRA